MFKVNHVFSQDEAAAVVVELIPSVDVNLVADPMDISVDKSDAFSKALLTVEDIDADDKDNPQLVSDYVNDIYHYMRKLEVQRVLKITAYWNILWCLWAFVAV